MSQLQHHLRSRNDPIVSARSLNLSVVVTAAPPATPLAEAHQGHGIAVDERKVAIGGAALMEIEAGTT
eukprot:m.144644 g.144644  ORF g.144644 m.144644 type:complete len:68 (-) comp14103_c0_seq5:1883-2086(-)